MSTTTGEAQWFQPTVRNRLSRTIVLTNFTILYGKFYDIKDPYNEIHGTQGTKIVSQGEHEWGHCGRNSSPTGTEGIFEVLLESTGDRIGEIYWDCPFFGSNRIVKRTVAPGYDISVEGFSIPSGPLRTGTITVRAEAQKK